MTFTVLPNALWNSSGSWPLTGGASHAAVLSDASDASFTKKSTSLAFDQIGMALQTATVPSTAVIQSVQFTVRHSRPNAASVLNVQLAIAGTVPGSFIWVGNVYSLPGAHTIYNYVSPVLDTATRAWSQSDIDNLVIRIIDKGSAANACTIYEVSALVTTNDRPVVTVTAPTGTISDTSTPLVSWTFTDTEGDVPEFFSVKIFSSAVYGAAGFDPETAAWSSATLLDHGLDTGTYTFPSLNGAGTYRAYVKLGVYNGPYIVWSDWAFSSFTFAVAPPALPTLSGTWAAAIAAANLLFAGHTNMLTADDADFITTAGNWVADTNCSVLRSTVQAMNGVASLRLSSTASGTMTAAIANTGAGREPVVTTLAYTATASFRASATGRTCRVGVRWLNASNTTIQTDFSPTVVSTTTGWTTAQNLFSPPGTAVTALVVVEVQSTGGAAELHYVDEVALYPGTASGFTNLLTNPSFEGGITGWSPFFSSPVSLTQDATHVSQGAQALKATSTSTTAALFGYNFTPVAGQTYTVSLDVFIPSAGGPTSVSIGFFIPGTTGTTSTTGSFQRISATFTATSSSPVYLGVTGNFTGIGQTFWIDAVQVETGSTPTIFTLPTASWTPGGYTTLTAIVQRSDDAGATWHDVYGSPFTLDLRTQQVSVPDYEASRGTPAVAGTPMFRARASGINSANGLAITSDYSVGITVPTTNDGQWWLKSLVAPTLNISSARVKENVPYATVEELGIFRPLGNSNAVVVHGDLHGEDGSLQVITRGPTERAALDALVARQDTIFVQDQQGYGKRVQWVGRARVLEGTANPEISTYNLDYVEVD